MDSENEQSCHQVKTRRFVLDNKHKCQIKRNHFSTHVSLPASAILFRKLCRLSQISSGRDGRASESGRRPFESTGIVLPIPAALPLAKRNRLICELILKQFVVGIYNNLSVKSQIDLSEPSRILKISMLEEIVFDGLIL